MSDLSGEKSPKRYCYLKDGVKKRYESKSAREKRKTEELRLEKEKEASLRRELAKLEQSRKISGKENRAAKGGGNDQSDNPAPPAQKAKRPDISKATKRKADAGGPPADEGDDGSGVSVSVTDIYISQSTYISNVRLYGPM